MMSLISFKYIGSSEMDLSKMKPLLKNRINFRQHLTWAPSRYMAGRLLLIVWMFGIIFLHLVINIDLGRHIHSHALQQLKDWLMPLFCAHYIY
jgi:hypothetical protein